MEETVTVMAPMPRWDPNIQQYSFNGIISSDRLSFPSNPNMIKVGPAASKGYIDETSITAAIARAVSMNTSTAATPVVIRVDPGTYYEANPLVVPAGVIVYGYSTLSTTVIATNPAAPVFRLYPNGTVRDLTAVGSGVAGVEFVGAQAPAGLGTVQNVLFTACTYGVRAVSGPSPVFVNECAFVTKSPSLAVGVGVKADAGASAHVTVSYSAGVYNGSGAILYPVGCVAEAAGAGAIVNIIGGGFGGATVGFRSRQSGTVAINGVIVRDCGTAILAEDGHFEASSLVIERSAVADLNIAHASAQVRIAFCTLEEDKVINPLNVVVRGITYSATEAASSIQGELHVGTPANPAPSYFGGGDSSASNQVCYISTAAFVGAAGTFGASFNPGLAGVAAFHPVTASESSVTTWYIGAPVPIAALEYAVSVACAQSGIASIAIEYAAADLANPAAVEWVPAARMVTAYDYPYPSEADSLFASTGKKVARVGVDPDRAWIASTPTDGTTTLPSRYWLRVRPLVAIASPPTLTAAYYFGSTVRLGATGHIERIGSATASRDLDWAIAGTRTLGVLTGPRLTAGLGLSLTDNSLPAGVATTLGLATRLPSSVDTSRGVRFVMVCTGDATTAGDIAWQLRWASTSASGETLTVAGATDSREHVDTYVTTAPVAAVDSAVTFVAGPFWLDVQQYNGRPASGEPDVLWMSIGRVGTDAEDTYGGTVRIVEVRATASDTY